MKNCKGRDCFASLAMTVTGLAMTVTGLQRGLTNSKIALYYTEAGVLTNC